MNKKKKMLFIILFAIAFVGLSGIVANAAPNNVDLPNVNISIGGEGEGTPQDYVSNIKLMLFFTVLTLLPSIMIMVTSFTRIIIVFSFLKSAMGVQQSIPNQILVGLAIFLTFFIMTPVYNEMNENGIKPYLENQITQEQAIQEGGKPLKQFMLKQTRQKDLELFVEASDLQDEELSEENIPFSVVVPAFAISELKTAFQIGFLLYLPFLLIDMVVGSVLMSMGMFMLPPVMVSLPFKLLLFVMVDGWYLLVQSLIMSFS
ncbi:flagellar type III secretion system pore protein FliP [Clostridium paraputrificum]|uniref:flagellar type III secretion system pore protein FliP n=1 Tax=Clostridium TaxID=1485 RepID=UPI003D341263